MKILTFLDMDCGFFKCHSLLLTFILFIFFTSNINAQINDSLNKGQFLEESLMSILTDLEITSDSAIFVNLQSYESRDIHKLFLQEILLNNTYTVVETEQFADYSVTIRVEENFVSKKTASIFVTHELIKETSFIVQVLRIKDYKVMDIKRFKFEEKHQQEKNVKDKWYSPFLVTFVIGSLIYLLYYGNN